MKRSLLFIVNPISGRGRGATVIDFIQEYFSGQGLDFTIEKTNNPMHARQLANAAASEGVTDIIAVGGDGTANEVASGMMGSGSRFGLFPCGTGNDLARTLQLPKNWPDIGRVLAEGNTTWIDTGLINGKLFINSTGTGFDAAVAADVNLRRTRLKGFPAYFIYVLKELIFFKRGTVRIDIEDESLERRPWLIAVTNGESYGAGMRICPGAVHDDGVFDICIVGDVPRWQIPVYVPLIMAGKHQNLPKIEFFKASSLTIETTGYWVQADGEVFTANRLVYEIAPVSLEVIVPTEAD